MTEIVFFLYLITSQFFHHLKNLMPYLPTLNAILELKRSLYACESMIFEILGFFVLKKFKI